MTSIPSVVIHAHLYQPPREDPWDGKVAAEPSAAPFHNWNERILAECYGPLTRAHVLDARGRIAARVQTLEWMSWDAGPTLLDWLVEADPGVYAAFLQADRRSRGRLGFGNALAAPYHHVILPLASRRDKVTEVRWGIRDFRRRFGREPEGMWLPETAVDRETLEVLAREGIAYTVVAPHQLHPLPPGGAPGRIELDGGRSMALFPYDGGLSHGVAFGALLRDARVWVDEIQGRAREAGRSLVSLATDGETFGHHHPWGDMALAATLLRLEEAGSVRLENYASFLHRYPARVDVELVEPTSWSCAHGVDRWQRACGCGAGPEGAEGQRWREVLRAALQEVADQVHRHFEREAGAVVADPWALRDAWGPRWRDTPAAQAEWVREWVEKGAGGGGSRKPADPGGGASKVVAPGGSPAKVAAPAGSASEEAAPERILRLLEAERDALRMFTSCGWFFDDIARLEPVQLLRYAARALELLGLRGGPVEDRLRSRLAQARSNDPDAGTGLTLWETRVRGANGGGTGAGGAAPVVREFGPSHPLPDAVRTFVRAPSADAAALVQRAAAHAPAQALEEARARFAAGVVRSHLPPPRPVVQVAETLGFGPRFLLPRGAGGEGPVGFVFGLHLHQPVGNFDWVFQEHTDRVYLPLLKTLAERDLLPLTLHVSGPLLSWLEARGHALLDHVGALAADGRVELLLSGFHEPVLPALPRSERVEQIQWMRDWLHSRFGVDPGGLWLTERVWEPDLVEDLVQAGVRYTLVDDRHLAVAGHPVASLDRPFATASGGKSMALLPISERLRYLVPFRPFEALEAFFRGERAEGRRLAVLADDGEKFGGWPGTYRWVWEEGWMERFLSGMARLREEGVVELLSGEEAVARIPAAGPVYLPSASYREMEGWSLPPAAALMLEEAEAADLASTATVASASGEGSPQDGEGDGGSGDSGRAGDSGDSGRSGDWPWTGAQAGALRRGGHWRNFLARYSESARMQHKADLLARLARERGASQELLQRLGRSRCNDPYWHGVFGGLYLGHLRRAIWESLAEAEGALREGEGLAWEEVPGPGGVGRELWIHAPAFSATVSLHQGGALVEWSCLRTRRNLADVLTRRWEPYHRLSPHGEDAAAHEAETHGAGAETPAHDPAAGMPSIHETEGRAGVSVLPPVDPGDRALSAERILPGGLDPERYAAAAWDPLRSWAGETPRWEVEEGEGHLTVRLRFDGAGAFSRELRFSAGGEVDLQYRWDPGDFPSHAEFVVALSTAEPLDPAWITPPTRVLRQEIRTFSRSEQGMESAVQGHEVSGFWPVGVGEARVRLRFP